MSRWRRRALALFAALVVSPPTALVVASLFVSLPDELTGERYASSVRVLDRQGALIRHVRADDTQLAQRRPLDELGPDVVAAIIAAEDRRFYAHPGVDPLSIARAAAQLAWRRRIVSGASTLTQQLARTLRPRPRTLWGKLGEMALALKIERSLSKAQILEEYLARVAFAPGVRGVDAAARTYFDKGARELSLGEAAALAGMPRGPSIYDPRKHPERLLARRAVVLSRLAGVDPERARLAASEPLALTDARPPAAARHFVYAVTRGALATPGTHAELVTTLDVPLQREAEALTRATVARLADRRATAAAAVVLDNATGDVLAYVGSPDADDRRALGGNDGVLAKRQPGSALKPFVYELALERRQLTAATALPDLPLVFRGAHGEFRPRDYDGQFHGPVRAREALASSLNVPAVVVAERLGPDAVLDRLRALGFDTLDGDGARYGPAIALGDGETRLLDLASAYATLARGGELLPVRAITATRAPGGPIVALEPATPVRVLQPTEVELVTDILSDDAARAMSFGRHGVLELPFSVAVKTGTSKGFRDNLTVGYTREVTVAVWVGNFDGSPMVGVSGVTGAGPLFHDLMMAAMRRVRAPQSLARGLPLVSREVCSLSGELAGPHCPHHQAERFAPGTEPRSTCDQHVEVSVDEHSGLPAGPACRDRTTRVFERYPPTLQAWARAAKRPTLPSRAAPGCERGAVTASSDDGEPRVTEPRDGARYLLDPSLGERQAVLVRTSGARLDARIMLDGRALPHGPSPGTALARPGPGEHRVWIETDGARSDVVTFVVE